MHITTNVLPHHHLLSSWLDAFNLETPICGGVDANHPPHQSNLQKHDGGKTKERETAKKMERGHTNGQSSSVKNLTRKPKIRINNCLVGCVTRKNGDTFDDDDGEFEKSEL